jgi:hypothetical protein
MKTAFIYFIIYLVMVSQISARCGRLCRYRKARKLEAIRLAQQKHVNDTLAAEYISIMHSDLYYLQKQSFYKPLCKVIDETFSLYTNYSAHDVQVGLSQDLTEIDKYYIAQNITIWYHELVYKKNNFPKTFREGDVNITSNFTDVLLYYNYHCYSPKITHIPGIIMLTAILLFGFMS